MGDAPVFYAEGNDPEMGEASASARTTIRYLWRELAWERRRIIPGLNVASIKVAFTDADDAPDPDDPSVEHMWIGDVTFDTNTIAGTLLNQPNGLKSVSQGDHVRVPPTRVGDWMYAIDGRVYGAYTVNALRKRMPPDERNAHDEAWGLAFGDPSSIEVIPAADGGPADLDAEHPMAVNMAPKLRELVTANPSVCTSDDERGWTLLHEMAFAGSVDCLTALLDAGADRRAKTLDGLTAKDIAERMGWPKAAALL